MGRLSTTIVAACVAMLLLASMAYAGDCGKCREHESAKCGKTPACGGCKSDSPHCESCKPKCSTGCTSKIDLHHGSGSLQDLLPANSSHSLIDPDCCPKEAYELLPRVSWKGYTLCCSQGDFELLCTKCKKKCDGSCKPQKPKCRQSTCTSCR